MAEQSGKPTTGTRARVYMSDSSELQAQVIAGQLERALGMKGSSIQEQRGRWDGKSEAGHVVEIVCDWIGERAVCDIVKDELAGHVKALGLTFYVTVESVTCMEIF